MIHATKLTATIEGTEYQWCGCHGNVLLSEERGVKKNDERLIGDMTWFAFSVEMRGWAYPIVGWCPLMEVEVDQQWIRQFKLELFR